MTNETPLWTHKSMAQAWVLAVIAVVIVLREAQGRPVDLSGAVVCGLCAVQLAVSAWLGRWAERRPNNTRVLATALAAVVMLFLLAVIAVGWKDAIADRLGHAIGANR